MEVSESYFQFDLKPEQLKIKKDAIRRNDQLVSLPTGFGKSVTYTLQSLVLQKVSHLLI